MATKQQIINYINQKLIIADSWQSISVGVRAKYRIFSADPVSNNYLAIVDAFIRYKYKSKHGTLSQITNKENCSNENRR